MKIIKKLFLVALSAGLLSVPTLNNANAADTTVDDLNKLVTKYYNNGVYTKKTQIDATEAFKNDIATYFHGTSVQLDRTTYYKGNALLMGDFDGGFDEINSGYGTETSTGKMTHFVYNTDKNSTKIDYTVSKTHKNWHNSNLDGMEGFYFTLHDMTSSDYFKNWTANTYTVENANDPYLADFLNFTAPCLYDTVLGTNFVTAKGITLKIEDKTTYLSLQIILGSTNSGSVKNTSRILSEARVYIDNILFNEEISYSLVVNNKDSYDMVAHTTEGEVKAEGISLKAGDTFHVENSFGWEYNKVKNSEYSTGFEAPHDGNYDFYYHTTELHTWVTVPEDPNAGIISINFIMTWDNVTEVWLNGKEMTDTDNDGTWSIEIKEKSISSLSLNFKQSNSWWHIEKSGNKSWNIENSIDVDMKAGNTYNIDNVNYTYQWDTQEHKWFTCTITES